MSTWKARFTKRLKSPSRRMHPFPCSALLACFGNTRENAPFDQPSTADTHSTIYIQPMAKASRHASHSKGEEGIPEKRRDSGIRSEKNGSTNLNSSNHTVNQPAETPEDSPGSPEDKLDCEAVTFQTSIPRPSIIEMPAEEGSQEEPKCLELEQKMASGSCLKPTGPKQRKGSLPEPNPRTLSEVPRGRGRAPLGAAASPERRARSQRGAARRGGAGRGRGRGFRRPPRPRTPPPPHAPAPPRRLIRTRGAAGRSRRPRRLGAALRSRAAGRRRGRPQRAPGREPRAFVSAPR
ncbi:unnamed protein product [Nyctereutes procyonoides]|uniref:(raccoon dog) hypothetical protein n=1 Tax=Nyctereutes procyonoides TaxID=34880 RepID=A0A811YNQ4_NYCPR|nr:unnamed protein product [Nyctereutes procyonoides]